VALVERGTSNRGESTWRRTITEAARPGITLLDVRTRLTTPASVDAVVLQPTRITVVMCEHTEQHGPLALATAADWTVGGAPAEFVHGPMPHHVARRVATALATTLGVAGVSFPFLEWVVAVDGDVTLESPRLLGDGTVCLLRQLPAALAVGSSDTTAMPVELARVICTALGGPEHSLRALPSKGFDSAVAGSGPSDWRPRGEQGYLLEAGEVALWEGSPHGACRWGAAIGRGVAGLRRRHLRSFRYRRCHFVLTNQRALVLDRHDDILRQCRLVPDLVAVHQGKQGQGGYVIFGTRRLHPNDLAGYGRHLAFYGIETADVLSCLNSLWHSSCS
jgi:hypothetical protein